MERILNNDDKVKRAEAIYYRRKNGNSSSRLTKLEGEKKSYLGSKILLEVLLIANLSLFIMAIQNKEYVFTEAFLEDIQKYNINITQTIKEWMGIEMEKSDDIIEKQSEEATTKEQVSGEQVEHEQMIEGVNEENMIQETVKESSINDIVPNDEGVAYSVNQLDENIEKIKERVMFQKPLQEGIITSRFGNRESTNKNVEGYHTGVDIGAEKRNINLFSNFTELLL